MSFIFLSQRNFNETKISETNTLKGSIGTLKFDGRINETQVSEVSQTETCKLNYPAAGGGYP